MTLPVLWAKNQIEYEFDFLDSLLSEVVVFSRARLPRAPSLSFKVVLT
jgi:hypothetical protein